MVRLLMSLAVLTALLCASAASAQNQKHDPRIAQAEMLALINMDPVDVSYRTNYDTHETGVLLVPSSGPLQGKTKWYSGLAVPAGTLIDIPKGAKKEFVTFRSPNGQETPAMKITLLGEQEAVVNACGNHHRPERSMLVKLIEPETREVIKEVEKETWVGLTAAELRAALTAMEDRLAATPTATTTATASVRRRRCGTLCYAGIGLGIAAVSGTVGYFLGRRGDDDDGGDQAATEEKVHSLPPCMNLPCE